MKVRFLLFLSYLPLWFFAQQDTSNALTTTGEDGIFFNDWQNPNPDDTLINNLHQYHSFNSNGNLGLANAASGPEMIDARLGLQFYSIPHSKDWFNARNQIYLKPKHIYARFLGVAGQKQEQVLKMLYAQNFAKYFTAGVMLNRYKCDGFYLKQMSFVNNFAGNLQFESKKKRYAFYSYILFNKIKAQENGGIRNDSLITESPTINKQLLSTNLSDAKRINRNLQAGLTQFIRLSRKDSTNKMQHLIAFNSHYQRDFFQYLDPFPMSGFYSQVLQDSIKTADSVHLQVFSNDVRYMIGNVSEKIRLYAGYRYDYSTLNRNKRDSIFINQSALFGAYWQTKNGDYQINLESEYIFDGPFNGDYKIALWDDWKMKFLKSRMLSKIIFENRTPQQLYQYYYGNHNYWNNVLVKTNKFSGWFFWDFTKIKTGVELLGNWEQFPVYFDSLQKAKQFDGSILNAKASVWNRLKLWRIGFYNRLTYQINNNNEIIRQPDYFIQSQLYYEGSHFKNNLQIQFGVQLFYFPAYKALAYSPSINAFYLQNKMTAGNYPYLDVFINMQIRPVQFFILVSHANYGLTGSDFYQTPSYFQADRSVKAGVKWVFND